MTNFSNNHSVRLDLAGEIREAVIQYAAKHHLDKEFACQCLVLKQLRSEGLIGDEVYVFYLERYSRPVAVNTPFMQAGNKPLTFDQLKAKQKIDEMTRYFKSILTDQWSLHESREWRLKTLAVADKWKAEIPEAGKVLELGEYLLG